MTDEQRASIAKAAIKVELEVLSLKGRTAPAAALKEYLDTAGNESLVRLFNILRMA